MARPYARQLLLSFALAGGGAGCAAHLRQVNTNTCVRTEQQAMNIPLLYSSNSRRDIYDHDCETARAAAVIAGIKKTNGAPDPAAEAIALDIYARSNDRIRVFMNAMLREKGRSLESLRFDIQRAHDAENPVSCRRVAEKTPDGGQATAILCTDKNNAAPGRNR